MARRLAPPAPRCAAGLLLVAALAAGCSTDQIYNAAAGWRRNECYKLGELEQRERCLKEADRPYDAYRAGTGASR